MGMDGISISNTGAIKEKTSAELTNKTEQQIYSDPTNSPDHVNALNVKRRVQEKDSENDDSSKKQKKDNSAKEEIFEDGYVETPELPEEEPDIEDIENPNKDFYVKLNVKDDIIELYDSATNRLIETISGNELGELVQKLNMASGIFINKKV